MKKAIALTGLFFVLLGWAPKSYADWVNVNIVQVAQNGTAAWIVGTSTNGAFTGNHVFVFPNAYLSTFLATALSAQATTKTVSLFIDSIDNNPSACTAMGVE
jgi:hypothetical protein